MNHRLLAGLSVAALIAGGTVLGVGLSRGPAAPAPASAPVAAPASAAVVATSTPTPASTGPDAVADSSGETVPGKVTRAKAVDPALVPVEIRIPSIGVSSKLVQLGLAGGGALQVPSDFQRAGWLKTGPAPGEQGPAVIAGHVDSKAGPAVFAKLRTLKPGATVQVRQAGGATVTFTVDGSEQVSKNHFPTTEVYGPVPGPVLRLITCGGSFDSSTGHYRDNVVVYASIHA